MLKKKHKLREEKNFQTICLKWVLKSVSKAIAEIYKEQVQSVGQLHCGYEGGEGVHTQLYNQCENQSVLHSFVGQGSLICQTKLQAKLCMLNKWRKK